MINSGIEWTDNTFNPLHLPGGGFYCFKVSPGCTNCYAEVVSKWICGMKHREFEPYTNRKKDEYPELELNRGMLDGWAKKRDPKLNFVSSMTDIFGEFVQHAEIFLILDAMIAAKRQTFQVLTKRAERAMQMIAAYCNVKGIDKLPENIWIIFSVENQATADERIPFLLKTRCSVRGLSMEPLLGPVDITQKRINYSVPTRYTDGGIGIEWTDPGDSFIGLDWIIVGGESGNKARPMHPKWARSLRDQCIKSNVPIFFKQWGEYIPISEWEGQIDPKKVVTMPDASGDDMMISYLRVGKKEAGGIIDGKIWHQFPHYFDYDKRMPKQRGLTLAK